MPELFKSKEGIYLEHFLKENGKQLENKRYLYVVSMNLDNHHIRNNNNKKIYKFGIGGMNYRDKVHNPYPTRLKGYVIAYGLNNNDNLCQGVKLHYLFYTTYNKNTEAAKSKIHKMELQIKEKTKELRVPYPEITKILRGTERINTTYKNIIKIIKSTYNIIEREAENRYASIMRRGKLDNAVLVQKDNRGFIYIDEHNNVVIRQTKYRGKNDLVLE